MTKRTRLFVVVAAGILVAGLGTGLVASYVGLQNIVVMGGNGPAELEYVPQDAQMVAYANVRDVMDSELRQKLMVFHPDADGNDKFRQQTGINLEQDVDHIVAAAVGTNRNERPLLLARGRFDAPRIEALVREHGGTEQEHAGTRLLTHPEESFALSFLESDLVAIGTVDAVKRAIDTKASGVNVTANSDLMRHLRDVDDGNAWAVARFEALTGGAQLPAELRNQLPAITWFAASGHVNGGFHGEIRAEARDDAAANDLREVIRGFMALARMQAGQREELTELMNSVQLGGDGKTVSLGFEIGPEMIDALGAMRAAKPERPADPGL